MLISVVTIGTRVVRAKGDYVVGRTGTVIDINPRTERVQVDWDGERNTWVHVTVIEPENVPYEIVGTLGKWPIYKQI